MLFDVVPKQVEALDSSLLVLLLRKLLHAEAQKAGISLGGISVPLQITVADGGEDGRIEWTGGNVSTDYLPSRLCVFQSKASSIGPRGWKKECWTKSSQRKGQARVLTPALGSLIGSAGSYVGFTTEPLGGAKIGECLTAIREGIVEAGEDPAKLAAIKLYGSNEIAAWAERHPGVALWLAELRQGQNLGGFQTLDAWGRRSDFKATAYVADEKARYAIGEVRGAGNNLDATAARERIAEHISEPGRVVRLIGPSGLGKSRFVYEMLKDTASVRGGALNATTIFADYRSVGAGLLPLATELSQADRPSLLVVDECPREVAQSLAEIVTADASLARAITLDIDDRTIAGDAALNIVISPSGEDLVEGIIRQLLPRADDQHVALLRDIAGGFPRFAVLAAGGLGGGASIYQSMEDVVDRILKGSSLIDRDEIRALECLSLLDGVGTDGNAASELDTVAMSLARQSGDEMFEHLAKASQHDLVGRRSGQMTAQPLPIANFLALRRLRLIRPAVIERFVATVETALLESMLRRWRYFDVSPTMMQVTVNLLRQGGVVGSAASMLSHTGAAILDALVHIAPDRVADAIKERIVPMSLEELAENDEGRRNLVQALSKLVFRRRSFATAARALLRLAAVESEQWANNATGLFRQLFQLQLSGTEVPPADRFVIMDEGLNSDDPRLVNVCVEALAGAFLTYFTRFGETAQIGSGAPLKDWQPTTWDEVDGFLRSAVERLTSLRSSSPSAAARAEQILVGGAREVLGTDLYREFGETLRSISSDKGTWFEAIKAIGDWLYFDRPLKETDASIYVRRLYDEMLPRDIVEKAVLYSKFWQSDIRDPDVRYSENDKDFGYSERVARDIADTIARDKDLTRRAIQRMIPMELHGGAAFAEQLASSVDDPMGTFDIALDLAANNATAGPFLRGLLSGIDKRDSALANRCLDMARARADVKAPAIQLYSAIRMDEPRIQQVVAELKSGEIGAADVVVLSYGRGLDDLPAASLHPLLEELQNHGALGVGAGLEIALMYKYGEQGLSFELAGEIERLLTSPALLEDAKNSSRDSHLIESLFNKVWRNVGIRPDFAQGLLDQILRLASAESYRVQSDLKKPFRHIVTVLSQVVPEVAWDKIARFSEIATPNERYRLSQLTGVDSDSFDARPHGEAGPLFHVPIELSFEWADAEPERRSPFLMEFFPLLNSEGDTWHQAAEELALKYGRYQTFRKALGYRMRPRSWSGSIVPLLEVYLKPLETWFAHPIPALAAWAREQYSTLERWIESEREDEEG